MSLTTLDISGNSYDVYASIAEADRELVVDPARATVWASATDDKKIMYLVAATQRLNLLVWRGEKTGAGVQQNAFPRTGLVYRDGTDVATDEVPYGVERATAVLAGSIALDGSVADTGRSRQVVKRVKAGAAEVEFASAAASAIALRPIQDETVYELVREWLVGALASEAGTGAAAFGTDGVSAFQDSYDRSVGFS